MHSQCVGTQPIIGSMNYSYCYSCRTTYTGHRLEHDRQHASSDVPTPPIPEGMPRRAQGHTPLRNVRVPDDLWDAAKARAEADNTTVSEQIVAFLRDWTKGDQK